MTSSMLPLPGLSPVFGKTVIAKFNGGLLSSDGGVLALREVGDALASPIGWPFAGGTPRVSATARFEAAPKNGKVRCFKEVGADGPDTRFIVTNLTTRNARLLYEDVYCRRRQIT
jgi:hypothetical protein